MRRLVALVLCSFVIALVPPLGGARAADPPGPPSIVLILTDDQRFDTMWAMPIVRKRLADHGVTFTNAFVPNSVCCASRASILTGEYSHSTDVYSNTPPHGGFVSFRPHEGSTIATWLRQAGYTTALVGKYLNHYGDAGKAGYVPPGWDHWDAFAFDNGRYYNYPLNIDGTVVHHGHTAADYSTDVLARDAIHFIRTTKGPFFLYFAPYAPHGPANPAPGDKGRFSGLKPARPPNYNEQDVSDKPGWVRDMPRLDHSQAATIDTFRRNQYRSLLDVDRVVGHIVDALRAAGRLQNTMIVFTSDNGLGWGEHRWTGKKDAYEEGIRIPMIVRYDNMVHVARSDAHMVLNLDLAPTFARLAGASSPGIEGRSFLPVLRREADDWRTDFLLEHLQDSDAPIPSFCAVRTNRYVYVEYATGVEELYDLEADPYELTNRINDPDEAPLRDRLRERVRVLCNPPPPGFTFRH
jgi:arylsulfatase A-like enzyme